MTVAGLGEFRAVGDLLAPRAAVTNPGIVHIVGSETAEEDDRAAVGVRGQTEAGARGWTRREYSARLRTRSVEDQGRVILTAIRFIRSHSHLQVSSKSVSLFRLRWAVYPCVVIERIVVRVSTPEQNALSIRSVIDHAMPATEFGSCGNNCLAPDSTRPFPCVIQIGSAPERSRIGRTLVTAEQDRNLI